SRARWLAVALRDLVHGRARWSASFDEPGVAQSRREPDARWDRPAPVVRGSTADLYSRQPRVCEQLRQLADAGTRGRRDRPAKDRPGGGWPRRDLGWSGRPRG